MRIIANIRGELPTFEGGKFKQTFDYYHIRLSPEMNTIYLQQSYVSIGYEASECEAMQTEKKSAASY